MKFKTLCSVTVVKVSLLWIFQLLNRMLTLKLILTTAISVDNSKALQIGVWLNANLSEIQCNQREQRTIEWVRALKNNGITIAKVTFGL